MKKVKSIFALFVLFLMFSASNNRFPKTGLFVGEKAPNFQMTDSTAGTFDLRDLIFGLAMMLRRAFQI